MAGADGSDVAASKTMRRNQVLVEAAPHGRPFKGVDFPEYRYETNGMPSFSSRVWLDGTDVRGAPERQRCSRDAADLKADLMRRWGRNDRAAVCDHQHSLRSRRAAAQERRRSNIQDSTGMTALYAPSTCARRRDDDEAKSQISKPEELDATGMVKSPRTGSKPEHGAQEADHRRHNNLVGDTSLGEGATPLAGPQNE